MFTPPVSGIPCAPTLSTAPLSKSASQQPDSPSGLAHSAGLWQLHQPPWHWLRPPGSYGSVPPAKPAAPEALQPADTSAQGWATPQPARPLPFSPCEEATPEDGSLGLQEKEVPKPPEYEAKPTREARHYIRQAEPPPQSVEASRSGRNRKALEVCQLWKFLMPALCVGVRVTWQLCCISHASCTLFMNTQEHQRHIRALLQNLPEALQVKPVGRLSARQAVQCRPVSAPQTSLGLLPHCHRAVQSLHPRPGPPAALSEETQSKNSGRLVAALMPGENV